MGNTAKFIAALFLILVGLFGQKGWEYLQSQNDEDEVTPEVVVIDEPSEQYKNAVNGVVAIDIEDEDAKMLADFYLEVASVVENDDELIKNTGQFREFNVLSGTLNFGGLDMKDKYERLGESVDDAIKDTIGVKNVQLDEENRSKLVEVLKAVAWGVNQ